MRSLDTHPLAGQRLLTAGREVIFESTFDLDATPWLADHRIFGKIVMPSACYLEMAAQVAREVDTGKPLRPSDLVISTPMLLAPGEARIVQTVIFPEERGSWPIAIFSRAPDGDFTEHVAGRLARPNVAADVNLGDALARCSNEIRFAAIYDATAGSGLEYGPAFRNVERAWGGEREAIARVAIPDTTPTDGYIMHPRLLDGCLQVIGAAAAGYGSALCLPLGFESVQLERNPGCSVWCLARLRPIASTETILADLLLFDRDETAIGAITGVALKRADTKALVRAAARSARDTLCRLDWEPAAASSTRAVPCCLIIGGDARLASELARRDIRVKTAAAAAAAVPHFVASGGEHIVFVADAPETSPAAANRWCERLQETVDGCGRTTNVRLFVVTRRAQPVAGRQALAPASAALWGLARMIALDNPTWKVALVDLDAPEESEESARLADEILSAESEDQIAHRNGARYVGRLRHARLDTDECGIELPRPRDGVLEHLAWREAERRPPGVNEVEVRVAASGLNFRDVLDALGMFPDRGAALGGEFSGRVVRVGAEVIGIRCGDEVLGLGPGALGRYVTTISDLVVPKPCALSHDEAVTAPITWLTAWWGLIELAKLRAGERVLIHAGAGGVGMMAIQLGQSVGAEVWATAGSEHKRALLAELGVEHVLDSRTLDFAAQVRQQTGGAGVDVVLNSLSSKFIAASLSILSEKGRFLEIGMRDVWTADQVRAVRPDAFYFQYDIADLCLERRHEARQLLHRMVDQLQQGRITPLPRQRFPHQQVAEAFRFMAQARHTGKVVVTHAEVPHRRISGDGTYVVTAGLGAIGLEAARWLAREGAKSIVLTDRKLERDVSARLAEIESRGAHVRLLEMDVEDLTSVRRVLSGISQLRGIVHAVDVIDEDTSATLGGAALRHAVSAKTVGAWNLHDATSNRPLEHFIMLSSATGPAGSPGRTGAAAANAYLDGLAAYRVGRGQPGLSLTFGPMASTSDSSELGGGWRPGAVAALDVWRGLAALGHVITVASGAIGVVDADWNNVPRSGSGWARASALGGLTGTGLPQHVRGELRSVLDATPVAKRRAVALDLVQEQVAKVMRLDGSHMPDPHRGFFDLGMDSLLAIELKNRLETGFACTLPVTITFDCPDATQLADYLANSIAPADQKLSSGTGVSDETAFETMSDAELADLLRRELKSSAS